MSSAIIPVPEKLDLNADCKSLNFELFQQSYSNYELATGLFNKPEEQRVATLLSIIGRDALVVYNAFTWHEEERKTVDNILGKFEIYCKPRRNETYERYVFNSRRQRTGQPIDPYIVELKNLIRNCNYGHLEDSMMRDALVMGIKSNSVRESLLKENDLNLNKCINILRATERAKSHAATIDHRDSSPQDEAEMMDINKIQKENRKNPETRRCKFCGYNHPWNREKCPAFGKLCNECGKRNHFSKVCKNKKGNSVQKISEEEESDQEENFKIL